MLRSSRWNLCSAKILTSTWTERLSLKYCQLFLPVCTVLVKSILKDIKFFYYLNKHTRGRIFNFSKKIKKRNGILRRKFVRVREHAFENARFIGLAVVYFACLARCVYLHGNVCRSVAEARPPRISFPPISVSIATGERSNSRGYRQANRRLARVKRGDERTGEEDLRRP